MTVQSEFFSPSENDHNDWNIVYMEKRAADIVTRIREQAESAHQCWTMLAERTDRPEYAKSALECLLSAYRNTTQLFVGFNQTKVMKDSWGDQCLSLYAVTSVGIHYGVIFHRNHRPDPVEDAPDVPLWQGSKPTMTGRFCKHDFGTMSDLCLKPLGDSSKYDVKVEHGSCEEHGPQEEAFALPVLGTWSFHS